MWLANLIYKSLIGVKFLRLQGEHLRRRHVINPKTSSNNIYSTSDQSYEFNDTHV
jgi:hypothetical protein